MSRETDTISVLVPAYNECPALATGLDLLLTQTVEPREVIIVHSDSHDPTRALAGRDPRIRVIHRGVRLFAGAARNVGATHASGRWLAFMDADVKPARDWLENMLRAVRQDANRLVGGSIGCTETGGYWGLALWTTEFAPFHPLLPDREATALASGNMMVSAQAFAQVGGFPCRFPQGEDTLLGARLRAAGMTLWFCAGARVDHVNVDGFQHFAEHLFRQGQMSAVCRRAMSLPGSSAVRFWPFAFGLFASKFATIAYLVLRWGRGTRLRFCALAPGVLLGAVVWNVGFLSGLRHPIPSLGRELSPEAANRGSSASHHDGPTTG